MAVPSVEQVSRRGPKDRPLLLIGLGVVLFSTGPVLVAGSDTTGPVLSFWRLWIGVAFLGGITVAQLHRGSPPPHRLGWMWAGVCGAAFGVHQLFFMSAIKRTSVVDVTLMQLLAPILIGVLALLAFGERPGAGFRAWSALSLVGAAVVVLAGSSGAEGDPLGVALAALNVVFYAFYFVGSKLARVHIETVPFLFGVVVVAGIVVAGFVTLADEPVGGIDGHDLVIAAAIAIVPGAAGHFVTTWPLDRVPANVPPLMQLAMPFLAGSLAWLFVDQSVRPLHVVGGLITLAGVAGALRSPAGRDLIRGDVDPVILPGD